MPKIGNPFNIFTAGTHNKDAPAVAFGTKSDVLAIGREGWLGVVRGRVLGEVHRILSADSLRVDIPVTRGAAGIDQRLTIRRQTWIEFLSRLVGELKERGFFRNCGSGATNRPAHPPCGAHREERQCHKCRSDRRPPVSANLARCHGRIGCWRRVPHLFNLSDKPVAGRRNRLDVLRRLGIVVQRFPNLGDRPRKRVIRDEGVGPDDSHDLFFGQDPAGIFDQEQQQTK